MNDIVLNGETLEISRVVDSIEIEGFDHTFADGKAESKLVVASGGSPGPGPTPPVPVEDIKVTNTNHSIVTKFIDPTMTKATHTITIVFS